MNERIYKFTKIGIGIVKYQKTYTYWSPLPVPGMTILQPLEFPGEWGVFSSSEAPPGVSRVGAGHQKLGTSSSTPILGGGGRGFRLRQ